MIWISTLLCRVNSLKKHSQVPVLWPCRTPIFWEYPKVFCELLFWSNLNSLHAKLVFLLRSWPIIKCQQKRHAINKYSRFTSQPSFFNKKLLSSFINSPSLRIIGSQNWWFGEPRTLLYRVKPLYRRVQWFLVFNIFLQHFFWLSCFCWLLFFWTNQPTTRRFPTVPIPPEALRNQLNGMQGATWRKDELVDIPGWLHDVQTLRVDGRNLANHVGMANIPCIYRVLYTCRCCRIFSINSRGPITLSKDDWGVPITSKTHKGPFSVFGDWILRERLPSWDIW